MRCRISYLVVLILSSRLLASDFTPDPASVQREGPAYRYPQAGWIVVHVEGEPYERGVQQGKLLWREIEDYLKCYASTQSSKAPEESWKVMRTLVDALFLRRFDPELLEEMKGIADGAAEAGAKFDDRPLDLIDIVAINVWAEVMCLDDSLRALPNGLEGKAFDKPSPRAPGTPKASRCSAFAATGKATQDGKAIIGHITMFDLYPCNFFNIWLDVKPAKGHRVVIQGAPGSVQSGMDYYMNDAGMVMVETTISQTKFNPQGTSVGSRSRMAMQYGESIDDIVKILGSSNNGLYTNEWLIADMKTNEIASFELGTATSKLMRSSKGEWFGNTEGFYWGCNNTKDLSVRMETIAAANDRPADMTFCAEDRDRAWVKLYQQFKGKMDADFGKVAFGKPPLAARSSCDAKYTTADLAMQMKSNAHWGDPYGQIWEPDDEDRQKYPDIRAIVPSGWTVLTTTAPAPSSDDRNQLAVDLGKDDESADSGDTDDWNKPQPPPAWHGTILPASDGDVWLASAFAKYHDVVAREKQMLKKSAQLGEKDRDELAVELFQHRYASMTSPASKSALRKLQADQTDDAWFNVASGRGVLLLSDLRRRIGAEKFDAAMDAFGRANAGKTVSSDAFITAMQQAAGSANLKDFFDCWLYSTDPLPTLSLSNVHVEKDKEFVVTGEIASRGGCAPANVDVTVETDDDETPEATKTFAFDTGTLKFRIECAQEPLRVLVNKYGSTPCGNGFNWSIASYKRDLPDHALIVYGTRYDAIATRIAAEKLQTAIIEDWKHAIVPTKSDAEISDDDLRGRHLLLIGRPDCNEIVARYARSLPVNFGSRSFVVRGDTYANMDSAVIAAAANPADEKFSVVCIAGNDGRSTIRAVKSAAGAWEAGPVKILLPRGKSRNIVPPAAELAHELSPNR